MAASTGSKPSRWGNFLVGLESKLDTILADEDTLAQQKVDTASRSGTQTPARAPSVSKGQDRLSEKLAKARANRAQGRTGDLSAGSSTLPSQTVSPANGLTSPRASLDQKPEDSQEGLLNSKNAYDDVTKDSSASKEATLAKGPSNAGSLVIDHLTEDSSSARPSIESRRSISTRPSSDSARPAPGETSKVELGTARPEFERNSTEENEQTIEQMRADYEAAELTRQEETHGYLEKIDALQANLQYLSKEAAEIAKTNISNSEPNTSERKIAQRDEQIALLMEEGHKLSQMELKHMGIIKKLRLKSSADDKCLSEVKRLSERNEKLAKESSERAKRAEALEQQASIRLSSLPKLEKELEAVKADRSSQISTINDLRRQLKDAVDAVQNAEVERISEALAQEKMHVADLTEEIARLRAEREHQEKQLRTEVREIREKLEREQVRAKTLEIERQAERNTLESRLEAFRTRAEEASTGSGGDSQAKMLRQIETLQNQSAVASENWQGIESSLLGRIAGLEKERDEVLKKESMARRKAREDNIKSRRNEEQLESTTAKLQDLSSEHASQTAISESLREKLSKADSEVSMLKSQVANLIEKVSTLETKRIEDEKAHQRELESLRGTPETSYYQLRADSPAMSTHKRRDSLAKKHSPRNSKRYLGLDVTGFVAERPVSRRSSTQPFGVTEFRSPSRQDSSTMVPQFSVNGTVPETPSIIESQADDGFFSGAHTPTSPERTVADMVSASTSAAGPSVQLVERMSATVRRLESEKAASRDEMARLATQRDEARDQIVNLLREVEEARSTQDQIQALEADKAALEEKLNASLELLGEKSETVEELRNDVQDLKSMYRELVESKVGGASPG